jgi:hypothetical protein
MPEVGVVGMTVVPEVVAAESAAVMSETVLESPMSEAVVTLAVPATTVGKGLPRQELGQRDDSDGEALKHTSHSFHLTSYCRHPESGRACMVEPLVGQERRARARRRERPVPRLAERGTNTGQ